MYSVIYTDEPFVRNFLITSKKRLQGNLIFSELLSMRYPAIERFRLDLICIDNSEHSGNKTQEENVYSRCPPVEYLICQGNHK